MHLSFVLLLSFFYRINFCDWGAVEKESEGDGWGAVCSGGGFTAPLGADAADMSLGGSLHDGPPPAQPVPLPDRRQQQRRRLASIPYHHWNTVSDWDFIACLELNT